MKEETTVAMKVDTPREYPQLRGQFMVLGFALTPVTKLTLQGVPTVHDEAGQKREMAAVEAAINEGMMQILRWLTTVDDPNALKAELQSLGIGSRSRREPSLEELMDVSGFTAAKAARS